MLKRVIEQLPWYVREVLESAPARGEGLNVWTFKAACYLHRSGLQLPDTVVEDLIAFYGGPEVKQSEIRRSVRKASIGVNNAEPVPLSPKWPQRNLGKIEEIALGNPGLPGLRSLSPIDGKQVDAEEAVDHLFPGNPLLCIGLTPKYCETLPREEWRGHLSKHQLIVPSPMSARGGISQEGRSSPRTLSNTGPRKFLVVEFDFRECDEGGNATPVASLLRRLREKDVAVWDLCASLHLHLSAYRRLAMVVHSGGKSLHGWYPCDDQTDSDLLGFMQYAVSLGADRATWVRCQFIRLPGGLRRPGKVRQSIEFFAPEACLQTPHV